MAVDIVSFFVYHEAPTFSETIILSFIVLMLIEIMEKKENENKRDE